MEVDWSPVVTMATQLFELRRLLSLGKTGRSILIGRYSKAMALLLEIVRVAGELSEFMTANGDSVLEHYEVEWLLPSVKPFRLRADVIYLQNRNEDGSAIKKRILIPVPLGLKLGQKLESKQP